jgi:hypothetical protein
LRRKVRSFPPFSRTSDKSSLIGGDTPHRGQNPPERCPNTFHFRTSLSAFTQHSELGTFPVAEVSLIHHHNPNRGGKQPKHPPKLASFAHFLADEFFRLPYTPAVAGFCFG